MSSISLKAYAKINLTLDVVSRRPDGYHNVEMIMQSVDLWDLITLQEIRQGIELDCNIPDLPRDEGNIAWRAAQLIKTEFNIETGIRITIHKNIPREAGLAGGSADCAAVLLGLNKIWNLGMDVKKLQALGKRLGADVPFCLVGGTALAEGIGDMLTPIKSKEDIWLVIIKPDFGVSTKEIYSKLKLEAIRNRPDNPRMIKYLETGDIQGISSSLANVLEEVTIPMHPQIHRLKEELVAHGALGALMSGSGPSVYGIFPDQEAARKAVQPLRERHGQVFMAKTVSKGTSLPSPDFCL